MSEESSELNSGGIGSNADTFQGFNLKEIMVIGTSLRLFDRANNEAVEELARSKGIQPSQLSIADLPEEMVMDAYHTKSAINKIDIIIGDAARKAGFGNLWDAGRKAIAEGKSEEEFFEIIAQEQKKIVQARELN